MMKDWLFVVLYLLVAVLMGVGAFYQAVWLYLVGLWLLLPLAMWALYSITKRMGHWLRRYTWQQPEPGSCKLPPKGWYCTLGAGHEGPCPTWEVQ